MIKEDLEIFKTIPTIETERLILRRMMPSDLSDVYDYAKRAEVSEFLLWYPHDTTAFTRKYLKIVDSKYKRGEFYDWAVVCKADGRMIGTAGFTSIDVYNNNAEIGYVLNSDYWGRGLAAEAARAVITFGFEALRLVRIEAKYMTDNLGSKRVAEKCGMREEGILRQSVYAKGRYVDVCLCSILVDEYKRLVSKSQ